MFSWYMFVGMGQLKWRKTNRWLIPMFFSNLMQPIVEAFSFLAIATSYIGFVLGLSDFISDCKSGFLLFRLTIVMWDNIVKGNDLLQLICTILCCNWYSGTIGNIIITPGPTFKRWPMARNCLIEKMRLPIYGPKMGSCNEKKGGSFYVIITFAIANYSSDNKVCPVVF